MRRKHHRRCQGRLTRLASLARSLTSPAAAGRLLALAALLVITPAQGDWLALHTVDLFPYDAGTEEGTEFSLSNAATSPQGAITSIKGMGKFSNQPIASLTFTLQSVAPEITSAATFTVDEGTTAVETLTAKDQDTAETDLTWSIPTAGGADAGQFMLSAAGSVLPAGPVAEAPTVVRGPYLQSGTSSSVIIKWRTDEATDSLVRYGLDHDPDGLTLSATNSTSTTEHAVQLTGLSADVKYFYSVGSSSALHAGRRRPRSFRRHRSRPRHGEADANLGHRRFRHRRQECQSRPRCLSQFHGVARPGPLDHVGRQRL